MKQYIGLLLIFIVATSTALSQSNGAKKPVTVKVKALTTLKANLLVKAPFLKHSFMLDTAIFSGSSIDTNSRGTKRLTIKLKNIRSADITITDGSGVPVDWMIQALKNDYETNTFCPCRCSL